MESVYLLLGFILKFGGKYEYKQLIFINGGKGYIIVRHKRYPLKKGSLLYI